MMFWIAFGVVFFVVILCGAWAFESQADAAEKKRRRSDADGYAPSFDSGSSCDSGSGDSGGCGGGGD